MYIHSYQIHNVLNVYRKQLGQATPEKAKETSNSNGQESHKVTISAEGKRQSIINKVAENVIDKITKLEPETEFKQVMEQKLRGGQGKPQSTEFVFNTIDKNNNKITNSFSVENSSTLLKHFELMSKETE